MLTTMEKLIPILLDHPERFTASEVPCCLLGIWESAQDFKCNMQVDVLERDGRNTSSRNHLQPGPALKLDG
jgi:hypothetical protein